MSPQPERLGRTEIRLDPPDGAARCGVRTTLVRSDPTATVLRAMVLEHTADAARLALLPDGALLLAGDAIEVDVHVGAGLRLDLIEPAGTVAFDMRGARARWDVRVVLEAGAVLTWAGEPFVVAAGAEVERDISVQCGLGARVAMRETLVLGRFGEGPGRLRQHTRVVDDDGPVLVEDLVLDAASAPLVLGGHRVLTSVLAGAVAVAVDETETGGAGDPDRLELDVQGWTLWRRLGQEAHAAALPEPWRLVVEAVGGVDGRLEPHPLAGSGAGRP
ncbi:urease accessory protein UreD [Nocardioides sp.]|uniref:urease accessory protein UreD n=1 Tax=Nocardioides sp. TaxID=35761 RepID=UPI003514FEFF